MTNDWDDMFSSADDALLDALTAARPASIEPDHGDTPAARALLNEILAPATSATRRRPRAHTRPLRTAVGAASVAAAIVVAVVTVNSVGVDHGHVVVQQQPAAADVAVIATASAAAFASSGRANITFTSGVGASGAQTGTSQIAYSGKNLDVVLHSDGVNGDPGFEAHNLTVDGQFYLYDGPVGARHWIHDTTATPTGADNFDLDPRLLLGVLKASAGFVVVDTTTGASGPVRHLRATNPTGSPTLHLALGPVPGPEITSLDVWVGADNTVQKLAVATKHTESNTPPCFEQNGVKQCLKPGDLLQSVHGRIKIVPAGTAPNPQDGPARAIPSTKPSSTTGSYSVSFSDLGAPISITAPPNAVAVAGVG